MSIELVESPAAVADPLESLAAVAGALEIDVDRVDEVELHLAMPGAWRDAGLWFTWRPELSTIQMGAPLDIKVPEARVLETARLVTLINERLWIGHFDLWTEDRTLIYRNAIVLPEDASLDGVQAQVLIQGAGEAVDRFYPAFNYLLWGGKSPEDALEASMFETHGNA